MRTQVTFNTDFEWKLSFGITKQEAQQILNANSGDVLVIDNNQVTLRFSNNKMGYEKKIDNNACKTETVDLLHVRLVLERDFNLRRSV